MKYAQLKELKRGDFFTTQDLVFLLDIKPTSARVLSCRYTEKGLFVRLKKNLYVLKERWEQNSIEDFYKLSNVLQVPSYISFMTALSFYEVTTQVQRGVFESACIKRSVRYEIEGISFNFYKLKREFYFDFVKQKGFFIATKEKAFLDALYMHSLGRYVFDMDSIDLKKLDLNRMKKLLRKYPNKVKKWLKGYETFNQSGKI